MKNRDINTDLLVIGGGPGGLAAAVKAWDLGIEDITLLEREDYLGGILPQCIHSGFGLFEFKKEMTGPEYSQVFLDRLSSTGVRILIGSMALRIEEDLSVIYTSRAEGIKKIKAEAIILSLGCRERTRGQIMLPGTRPAGVFTAGVVQRMVNIEGYLPGKKVLILGSGDIGLIMARRLHLEGCEVLGVYELMPYSTGLTRNIYQCLEDYDIPLYLSHTVSNIHGIKRLEAVEITQVDKGQVPVKGSTSKIECDTLLLSVGLICENELTKTAGIEMDEGTGGPIVDEDFMTSKNGVFSCGNSLFVNDIVDNVTEVAYKAAEGAYAFINGKKTSKKKITDLKKGENVAYIVPHKINETKDLKIYIRPSKPLNSPRLELEGIGVKRNLKYVVPGELIQIGIKKENLLGAPDCVTADLIQR